MDYAQRLTLVFLDNKSCPTATTATVLSIFVSRCTVEKGFALGYWLRKHAGTLYPTNHKTKN